MPDSFTSSKDDKLRWKLLLKTLSNEISQLSATPYGSLSEMGPSGDDPASVLKGCRDMVDDLIDLVVKQSRHKKKQKTSQEKDRHESLQIMHVKDNVSTPNIPVPPLVASLRKVEADVLVIDSLMAQLTSKTPVKTHRSLLEQREILRAKRVRVQRQVDTMGAGGKDLLTIGSAVEIYDVTLSLVKSCPSVDDFLRFFRNFLIHAVILSIIEASFEENRKSRVSLVVGKILDMAVLARRNQSASQAVKEVKRVVEEVFEHSAITRLPLLRLLDKATLTKYNKRANDADVTVQESRTTKTTKSTDTGVIEHWILSQTWVSDAELMVDSFALQPQRASEAKDMNKEASAALPQVHQPVAREADGGSVEKNEVAPDDAGINSLEDRDIDVHSSSPGSVLRISEDHVEPEPDDYAIEFPSVPTNVVMSHGSNLHTPGDANDEVDEVEAQRLLTLFASSPNSSDDSENDEPDYSEMVDLTPAEQEEVLKALASAREHQVDHSSDDWAGEDKVAELMQQARAAMKDFDLDAEGKVEADGQTSDADSVD